MRIQPIGPTIPFLANKQNENKDDIKRPNPTENKETIAFKQLLKEMMEKDPVCKDKEEPKPTPCQPIKPQGYQVSFVGHWPNYNVPHYFENNRPVFKGSEGKLNFIA